MSLLGLDIGTTGCKAAAFSDDGTLLHSVYEEYPLRFPGPDRCELDPGTRYVFEFGVNSRTGSTSLYRYRVWPADRPDALLCDLATAGRESESPHGSALIIALYCDVTIGNLPAEPL